MEVSKIINNFLNSPTLVIVFTFNTSVIFPFATELLELSNFSQSDKIYTKVKTRDKKKVRYMRRFSKKKEEKKRNRVGKNKRVTQKTCAQHNL